MRQCHLNNENEIDFEIFIDFYFYFYVLDGQYKDKIPFFLSFLYKMILLIRDENEEE